MALSVQHSERKKVSSKDLRKTIFKNEGEIRLRLEKWFNMVAKEDAELTFSHRHNKSTNTYKIIPSERHLIINWMIRASTTKD